MKLSNHARDQIKYRFSDVLSESAVHSIVNRYNKFIHAHDQHVHVVVAITEHVECSDGSNGSYIVAVCDPNTDKVTTVMRTRPDQLERRAQAGQIVVY